MAVLRWWLLGGFVALLAVRVALAQLAPPTGFTASYWAGPAPQGFAERSTDFLSLLGGTRIDRTLDFQGDSFPVHFFNDAARFNFGPEAQPGRDRLPFSARWTGALDVPTDGERRFVLEAAGPARVMLDGAELLSASGSALTQLAAGRHALLVEYTRPEARVPRLRLSWERVPGAGLEVVSAGPPGLMGALDFGVLLLGAASCGVWIGRSRAWLALLPLAFLGYGAALLAPLNGRATILSGLDDWLVYESSARDILLNGPLMTGGQEHAAPYYGQPLYPYVLALAHLLTGEGLFGPLALQFAALGLLLTLAFVLAQRAFDSRIAALMALGGLWLFMGVQNEYFRVARQLFNENLYMPLVMLSLVVLVSLARRPTAPAWSRLLLTGVLLGLTTISRSQFLLFVPLALLIVGLAWRRWVPVLVLVAGLGLAVAPVTARNWVVSGQLVPISASGGASLLEFHRPPPGLVDPAAVQRDPLSEALRLDTSTRTVLAFARQDPAGYFATWLPLGAHSIGLPGRTGSGVYWPLLLVGLLYLLAFTVPEVRRRHVWLIHAFVASHLLVLMLFEADTYGYRLVMPMYAPMLVVAAQLPFALLATGHRFARRFGSGKRELLQAWSRPSSPRSGARLGPEMAAYLLSVVAILLQGKSLVEAWPDRETSLVGLGGPAARAALSAERVHADVIYVASVDGTPRRFGAGSLPGLRYPAFKWFDPVKSLPLPTAESTAVYALSELGSNRPAGDLTSCLGQPDASAELHTRGDEARARCAAALPRLIATFEGLTRIEAIEAPKTIEAGETAETRLLWQPLVAHPEPHQMWLHLEDAETGTLWGNGTLDLYPASQWEPGEALLSRLPIHTDATAMPDSYRLTLGMSPMRPNAPSASVTWQGARSDRLEVANVALVPSTRQLAMLELPPEMRPVSGLSGGGLELIAVRPPASEVAPGQRVRLGLLWRTLNDAPSASRVHLQLVRESGEVVQQAELPLFGGRVQPSTLRAGVIVRDEAAFEVAPRVAGEALGVQVWLAAPGEAVRVGTIDVAGRKHVFDSASQQPEAVFGRAMALLSHRFEPERARTGGTVTVNLRWRAEATLDRNYKVFVHVLDSTLQKVIAQRDTQPLEGRAPTMGWLPTELIDDELEIKLPSGLAAGEYPVEVGVYDERSGERLLLPSGESRLLLDTHLQVR